MIKIHLKCRAVTLAISNFLEENEFILYFSDNLYITSLGRLELYLTITLHSKVPEGFPGGAVVKNPPANAGDTGSSPGPGRSNMPRSN